MRKLGTLIAIEGQNSELVRSQSKFLARQLSNDGYETETFSFPRRDEPSGYFADAHLAGKYGDPSKVGPYSAAMFYALDRFEAVQAINQALNSNKVVLVSGYSG